MQRLYCSQWNLALILLLSLSTYGEGQETTRDWHLGSPIWSGDVVYGESVIPIQFEGATDIAGRLAFPAKEILSITLAESGKQLEMGRDASLSDDGRTLIFTASDSLQYMKESEFYLAPESPMSYRHRVDHPEQWMLYSSSGWFHERQIEVTYRKQGSSWDGWKPSLALEQLPKTLKRLQERQPLTVGFSGDSITAGGDASGLMHKSPEMPPYPNLATAELQKHYGGEVVLKNRAVGGWSVANGVQDLDALLAENPDLIVIAYGMNDVGRRNPEWFHDQTKTMVDRIKAHNPDIEIILVATMIGNAQWVHTPRDMFDKYRDELQKLTGPGVVLADVTSIWAELLKYKHDYDMIGNGLNHPNDFGHRLYAQAILGLLVPQ